MNVRLSDEVREKQKLFMQDMRRIDYVMDLYKKSQKTISEYMEEFDINNTNQVPTNAQMKALFLASGYTKEHAARSGCKTELECYKDARDQLGLILNGLFVEHVRNSIDVEMSSYEVIKCGEAALGSDGCAPCWIVAARTLDSRGAIVDIGVVHSPYGLEAPEIQDMLGVFVDEINENQDIVELNIVYACGLYNPVELAARRTTRIQVKVQEVTEYIKSLEFDRPITIKFLDKTGNQYLDDERVRDTIPFDHPQTEKERAHNRHLIDNDIDPNVVCGLIFDFHGNLYLRHFIE